MNMLSPENKIPKMTMPENAGEKKELFENIVFVEKKKKKTGEVVGYQSSAMDRKVIELSEFSIKPIPGRPYQVRIIGDTEPHDPTRGKYIGELIVSEIEKLTEEQWRDVENSVNAAEIPHRIAKKATSEFNRRAGIDKEGDNTSMGQIVGDLTIKTSYQRRVTGKAYARKVSAEAEAENILGKEGSPERVLVNLREKNLIEAFRENRLLELGMKSLRSEEVNILKNIKNEPGGSELDALEEIRKEIAALEKKHEELYQKSPEAFYGLHLKQLKEYKRASQVGGIIETDYVKHQTEDIVSHLRANKPVMIYGHLGCGKTELAMHIARKQIGKEALVISGAKNISMAEFYGHQVLSIDKINKTEIDNYIKEVEKKFQEWVGENSKATEDDKNRAHDRILQTYLTQFKGGTISNFFLGPIYRAMKEGRPIIIDEVNAIPHEILISLNHILTRKVGDIVSVQQDSGEEVKVQDGYGIIMTGNLNQGEERYIDRQDMDPAFLSRLYKVEYDYLPQKTEGDLGEAGPADELFQIMLAKVIDRNGNLEASGDIVRKIWNLAKMAKITQDVFSGKEVNSAYYFQIAAGNAVKYLLKEAVLSVRALDNILSQYQKEGYRYELDYYIWKEFVSQSTVAADRAYLYQLLKDRSVFFQGPGWERNPNYGNGDAISHFDVKPPKNSTAKKEFFGPREVVEFTYGKGPERAKWPGIE